MSYTPTFFFFFHEGKIIGHNLKTQKYYTIDTDTFEKLLKLSDGDKRGIATDNSQKFKELGFDEFDFESLWEGDTPSHISHLSSRIFSHNTPRLSKEAYIQEYTNLSQSASEVPQKDRIEESLIALPPPSLEELDKVSLAQCFKERKTTRDFNEEPLTLDSISNILYSCFGFIHGDHHEEFKKLGLKDIVRRRSSPSATGLYSCDAILWINKVDGLEPGLYSYDESAHALLKHSQNLTSEELVYGVMDQFWADSLSAGIFIINDLRRTWVKDMKCRGYVSCYLESGHLSQNVLLAATALNIRTWLSGAFRDDFLQAKLELPDYRFASLFIGLGLGSESALPEGYLELMDRNS